ncbi:helix-turn-helix domain-containing protein [Kineococcus xinjiangensis]|nr:helix-turn-helix domain-containing protein [Kineococcus xinjiangensis]
MRVDRSDGPAAPPTLPAPRPAAAERPPGVGDLLREWRRRRGLSQLALSERTGISTRHLSYVENGRAGASRDLVRRLADGLDLPDAAHDALLVAAGFVVHPDPGPAPDRRELQAVVDAHLPVPALVFDEDWNLVAANAPVRELLEGLPERLRREPVNMLRLTLDPDGLAPSIEDLPRVRAALLARVDAQLRQRARPVLAAVRAEVGATGVDAPPASAPEPAAGPGGVLIPLVLQTPRGVVRLVSTTTLLALPSGAGGPVLALETFSPADAASAALLAEPG